VYETGIPPESLLADPLVYEAVRAARVRMIEAEAEAEAERERVAAIRARLG
jgi:hypothetical protein